MLSRQSSVTPFESQKRMFTSVPGLRECVEKWQKGETDTLMIDETTPADGTMPGGNNLGKPLFQFLPVNKTTSEGGTMIYQSDNCISFIPAGFRNAETVNKMNPVREEIGGLSTLQSLVHILTIPKNKRIYNAVSLTKEDIPLLEEMKVCGEKAVNILTTGDENMIGSLKWQLNQKGNITMSDGTIVSQEFNLTTDLSSECESSMNSFMEEDEPHIEHTFHAYPSASIGWLHLHSFLGDMKTSAYDTMEYEAIQKGYTKNIDYSSVLQAVKTM